MASQRPDVEKTRAEPVGWSSKRMKSDKTCKKKLPYNRVTQFGSPIQRNLERRRMLAGPPTHLPTYLLLLAYFGRPHTWGAKGERVVAFHHPRAFLATTREHESPARLYRGISFPGTRGTRLCLPESERPYFPSLPTRKSRAVSYYSGLPRPHR